MAKYLRTIASILGPEPKPCKKFRHLRASDDFVAHLPECDACKFVLGYLRLDLNLRIFMHRHRN
jgi:hypothetical protein